MAVPIFRSFFLSNRLPFAGKEEFHKIDRAFAENGNDFSSQSGFQFTRSVTSSEYLSLGAYFESSVTFYRKLELETKYRINKKFPEPGEGSRVTLSFRCHAQRYRFGMEQGYSARCGKNQNHVHLWVIVRTFSIFGSI